MFKFVILADAFKISNDLTLTDIIRMQFLDESHSFVVFVCIRTHRYCVFDCGPWTSFQWCLKRFFVPSLFPCRCFEHDRLNRFPSRVQVLLRILDQFVLETGIHILLIAGITHTYTHRKSSDLLTLHADSAFRADTPQTASHLSVCLSVSLSVVLLQVRGWSWPLRVCVCVCLAVKVLCSHESAADQYYTGVKLALHSDLPQLAQVRPTISPFPAESNNFWKTEIPRVLSSNPSL